MKPNPPLRATRRHNAFTLIELLVVIAIIAVLAGLLLQTAGMVQEKASRSRADVEIHALCSALDSYKMDNGTFPEGDGGENSTKNLLDAIAPHNPPAGTKIYFEVPLKMMDSFRSSDSADTIRGSAKQLVDPFGNPYHYYFSAAAANAGGSQPNPVTSSQNNGPQFYDLWSYGKNPDKNRNYPATWIKNW